MWPDELGTLPATPHCRAAPEKELCSAFQVMFGSTLVEGVVHMDNVINLFSRRTAPKSAAQTRGSESTQQASSAVVLSPSSFADVSERNRVNQQRLRKEREQANKNVLKSYRIK